MSDPSGPDDDQRGAHPRKPSRTPYLGSWGCGRRKSQAGRGRVVWGQPTHRRSFLCPVGTRQHGAPALSAALLQRGGGRGAPARSLTEIRSGEFFPAGKHVAIGKHFVRWSFTVISIVPTGIPLATDVRSPLRRKNHVGSRFPALVSPPLPTLFFLSLSKRRTNICLRPAVDARSFVRATILDDWSLLVTRSCR